MRGEAYYITRTSTTIEETMNKKVKEESADGHPQT
jgi:hypothetical protein